MSRVLDRRPEPPARDSYRELFERSADAILITDVTMPNLSGPKLVSELRELGYEPRVLFMSGYTNEGLSQLHEIEEGVDMLEKPFRVRELVRRVHKALD